MEKRINLAAAYLALEVGLIKFEKDLEENFNKWPEDPNGTLINFEEFKVAYLKLVAYGNSLIEELVGKLPEIEVPTEPVKPVQGYSKKETLTGLRFLYNKPFTWLPEAGAKYGGKIKFVWPECDGAELIVPDARDNFSPHGYSHATYFCGTKNKPEEANGIRASIFGPAGCHATFVELHYN